MTNWQPTSNVDAARGRADMLQRIRQYFSDGDVLAVDTPAFSQYAVSDTNIESFELQPSFAKKQWYLNTSPEFAMKRLLAAGYPDIYSICRVFRDGELGKRHQPEFTMVEWYRLGFSMAEMITDTVQLIASALSITTLAATTGYAGARRLDYADAFRQYANVDVFDASIDELAASAAADAELREALGDDRDAWLDLILSTVICENFAADELTVLQHYPANQAALARLCPSDARVADRFEIFLGNSELANGYVELTDADQQLTRIESDQARRRRSGLTIRPHDKTLLAALQAGLPECAGVAVGLERLLMAFKQTDDIRDVIAFAHEN
jgi:lysyl-tRNA synthetase class 2